MGFTKTHSCLLSLALSGAMVSVAAFAGETAASVPVKEGRPDYCGVWGIWGGEKVEAKGRPWFKGVVVTTTWDAIEPRPEQFDWTDLDDKARLVADKGLYMMLMVYHGHKCPDWIYDQGVPKVQTEGESRNIHPYYLAPAFKPLLSRMIRAAAAHVASYPPDIRRRVIGIQCPTGKSGDPQPYQAPPLDKRYEIKSNSPEWVAWTLGMFPVYRDAYKDARPPVFLMFKGPNPESNDWLMEHLPDSWRKPHAVAQGYQFNNEMRYVMDLYPRTRRRIDGVLIRTRGELDNTSGRGKSWFNAAPVWNVYWTGLWVMTYGLDIWNQLAEALQDERFVPAFEFVSRYAGYKTPGESPGAWVALRDGLDSADVERFPEDRFGPVETKDGQLNVERMAKIAEAFASFGARMDDLENAAVSGLDTRHKMKGLNDVGHGLWRDNYAMFLSQIDANETSQGYWRVGPQDERFGRFARGFNHAQGKDALYFRLDDGFFVSAPSGGPEPLNVRVVYFDQGRGEWALRYDAIDSPDKTALTIRKTGSGQWREAKAAIADGRFAHRGPRQSDLWLVNADDEDDIFHMVELTRARE